MFIKYSFSKSVKELFHLIDQKEFKVAKLQIKKILDEDKHYKLLSPEYIKLLHIKALLQFEDREYYDAEVSIQNAMLQAKHSKIELYNMYYAMYYSLISFTNNEEIYWVTNHDKKKVNDENLTKMTQAHVLQYQAIGNLFTQQEAIEISVNLLKKSSDLEEVLSFSNCYNIAVIYYLFDNSNDKIQKTEQWLIKAYHQIHKTEQNINSLEDIWINYQIMEHSQFQRKDIKLLMLLSQHLLSKGQVKLFLQILNICNQVCKLKVQLKFYESEIQFLYAAYFFDQKQNDNCLTICNSIINTNLHPIHDILKYNCSQLLQKLSQNQEPKILSQPPKKAFRQPKQKQDGNSKKDIDKIKLLNASNYYYQFDTNLSQLFNLQSIQYEVHKQLQLLNRF